MLLAATSVLLACLLAAPPASAASAAPADGDYAAIDSYVRDRMDAAGVPGLSYAVVGPDGPVHQRSWGVDGRGEPVTARTPFLWGSVAKPVTATAVMTLVESGRLRLSDRVVEHLPGFGFGGTSHARAVTVGHLLGQTSGLPASATSAVADCRDAGCPRPAGRLGELADLEPLGAPGTVYAYTSANYLVLAAVVEAVTGEPYPDYLRRAVLRPAGMDGAITDAASARGRALRPGHQPLWGVASPVAGGVDDHGASYGYLGGDLTDLAAFAAFQLRSCDGVLSDGSILRMRRAGVLRPTGEGTGYGLGWRVGGLDAPLDGAVWHTGAAPGYSAMLFLLPGQDRALVLQQNRHGLLEDGAVMAVGFGAARLLAGGRAGAAPPAWSYHLAVWGTSVLAVVLAVGAVRAARAVRRPRPRPAVPLGWVVVGLVPAVAAVVLAGWTGVRPLLTWVPDVAVAAAGVVVAGSAVVVLRSVGVVRGRTGVRRRRPGPVGGGRAAAVPPGSSRARRT